MNDIHGSDDVVLEEASLRWSTRLPAMLEIDFRENAHETAVALEVNMRYVVRRRRFGTGVLITASGDRETIDRFKAALDSLAISID